MPPTEVGATLKTRPLAVVLGLAAALDDWASVRRSLRRYTAGAERLSEAAQIVDPDPWRNDLRAALDQPDKETRLAALRALAKRSRSDEMGAVSADLLGTALNDAGDAATAEAVLRRAQRRHPGDIWVNYDLAGVLEKLSRRDEAIRYYTAARSIRPETAHKLAHVLADKGESDEAIAIFQDLARLQPGNGLNLGCLASALQDLGRPGEATTVLEAGVAALNAEIRLRPRDAEAYNYLGNTLGRLGKGDDAIAAYRQAVRLKPDYAWAHINLGNALNAQGRLEEVVAEYRAAIRINPDNAEAHFNLGNALNAQGKFDGAIAAYRAALRLKPDVAEAHINLGAKLCDFKHDYVAAEAEFRAAIRLKPDYAVGHSDLGNVLREQGRLEEAEAEYRQAIAISQQLADDSPAVTQYRDFLCKHHTTLGNLLKDTGRSMEAVAELRMALAIHPKLADDGPAVTDFRIGLADSHQDLGWVLFDSGRSTEAEAEHRKTLAIHQKLADDNPAVADLRSRLAVSHKDLGWLLAFAGKLMDAEAEHDQGARDPPKAGRRQP